MYFSLKETKTFKNEQTVNNTHKYFVYYLSNDWQLVLLLSVIHVL